MSDVEAIEEISDQVRLGGNFKSRNNCGRYLHGLSISPQFERARAARPPKPKPTREKNVNTRSAAISEPAPPFIHTATDYNALVEGFRKRASSLDVSRENIDQIAGYPDRLASKILGPAKAKTCLGMQTLGGMLAALGLKILLVEDEEMLERYRNQRTKRDAAHVASVSAR